jgi:hypothetical protein
MVVRSQKSSIHGNNLKVERVHAAKKGRRATTRRKAASRREERERRAAGVGSRFGRMMSKASMKSAERTTRGAQMDAHHQNRSPCGREYIATTSIVTVRRDSPMRRVARLEPCALSMMGF